MNRLPAETFIPAAEFAKVKCEVKWEWDTRDINPLEDYDLWYVWDGHGTIVCNDQSFPAHKHSCFLFRPFDRTYGTHQPHNPLVVTYIHFELAQVPEKLPKTFREIKDPYVLESLLSRYIQIMYRKPPYYMDEARLLLKMCMLILLREDESGSALNPEQIALIRLMDETASYIRQHSGERHRIEQLAAKVHLAPRYFAAKFKQVHGISVEKFIIEARMERAEYLLRYSHLNVSEVSDALGYQNIHFFSRQYKQYRSMNPSQVRKE